MALKKIPPILGMNNVVEDSALELGGNAPGLYVRDAVNVDLSESGHIHIRKGLKLDTPLKLKYLWQSPLHKDCFALLDDKWVKVDSNTWEYEELVTIGFSQIYHIVLNNLVCVAGEYGLFVFDGQKATCLTMDTPAAPIATVKPFGGLPQGNYTFAISYVRNGVESGLSSFETAKFEEKSSILLNLPYNLDPSIQFVNVYMSEPNGLELKFYDQVDIHSLNISINNLPELKRVAQFQHLSPMKSGSYLKVWHGRLWVARSNVLYFSEALTYHLTDERYNFIQFPQKISFVEPVEGGIWIGQTDHVIFLRGNDVRQLTIEQKASRSPIPGSSYLLHSDIVVSDISQGGNGSAIWLAENGLVIGTASGQLIELQSKAIKGISGKNGSLVGLGKRVLAVVS